jgi:ferredoxin, 2Fe-2S
MVPHLKLVVIDRAGAQQEVACASGEVLMEVLRDNVDFNIGTCGGSISCGTCRVFVSAEWQARLAPASAAEVEMLEALGDEPGARLGCQIVLADSHDGLRLTIAPRHD